MATGLCTAKKHEEGKRAEAIDHDHRQSHYQSQKEYDTLKTSFAQVFSAGKRS
ncbi:MAG: hypothetical protein JO031_16020 [Ktedonobacteraceae bacterium]|nr:hypothetical protein [Ktedonobacteraceae bacterium]